MSASTEQLPEPIAPDALQQDLANLHRTHVQIPAEIDLAILRSARAQYATRRQRHARVRWIIGSLSAAAALVLLALRFGPPQGGPPQQPIAIAIKGDADRNGHVDILDALIVAKQIRAQTTLDKAWDVNGDGKVDTADVDQIGAMAVRVSEGGTQ